MNIWSGNWVSEWTSAYDAKSGEKAVWRYFCRRTAGNEGDAFKNERKCAQVQRVSRNGYVWDHGEDQTAENAGKIDLIEKKNFIYYSNNEKG